MMKMAKSIMVAMIAAEYQTGRAAKQWFAMLGMMMDSGMQAKLRMSAWTTVQIPMNTSEQLQKKVIRGVEKMRRYNSMNDSFTMFIATLYIRMTA